MGIDLIVIRTNQPKELSVFYEQLGMDFEYLDGTILKLKENKVEIVREAKASEWGYFAIVRDLDGRKIELKEQKNEPYIKKE